MRKLMVLPMAALLALAVAAPVSAGPNVSNSNGSALTAQGSWKSQDGGIESSGWVGAWQNAGSSSAAIDYFEERGAYVDCTPADDTDDFFGLQAQYRYGTGEGTLTVGGQLGDAHASAILEITTVDVDDCIGTYTESSVGGVAVELDMVAAGPKVMERGTWSFHIPSESNSHSSYRTVFRGAVGTVTVGDGPAMSVDGGIGEVSWRDHNNS